MLLQRGLPSIHYKAMNFEFTDRKKNEWPFMKQLKRTGLFTLPCDDRWHLQLPISPLAQLYRDVPVGKHTRSHTNKPFFHFCNPTHLVSFVPLLMRSMFRLSALLHVLLPGQSWPILGGCTSPCFSAASKRQADSSETKQFTIINEDIFHLVEKR